MMAYLVIYRLGFALVESGLQEYGFFFFFFRLRHSRTRGITQSTSSSSHGVSDGFPSPACWGRSENEDMDSGIHGLTLEDWNKSTHESHGKEVEDNTGI
ncbi:hypothetical protein QR685DRAFT_599442 [Neurospora intermedia]|uniref:Uncharacterized protein n=1 Tax=Neurospora intermedia TaxID=5142 RepID=A0ABR3D5K8_NEUIN